MLGKLLKVTSFVDDYGQLVVYVSFLKSKYRYIWKDDVFIGRYKA